MPSNVKRFSACLSNHFFLTLIYFLAEFSSFKKNFQDNLPPLNLQKDFPLLNADLSCPASGAGPAEDISLNADLNANAHAQVAIGLAVQGTVVPPKLSEVAVYASKQKHDYFHPRENH
jgi:hypothetical protein